MRFVALALVAGLTAAASAQTPATPLHLIPMPREVAFKGDQPVTAVTVECPNCGADDQFAAGDLRDELAAIGIPAGDGLRIVLQRLGQHPDPSFTDAMRPEGYTIASAPGILTLTGATGPGVFYAAQTVKQMIERSANGSFVLHAADIRDWPAMQYRGLSDDLSRGPVDTLDFQKKIVRTLAAYKANLYSPYFENTQQYASNPLPAPPGGSISADDARELVAYAAKYHVMIVPDQEAFGHLRHMLVYDQYQQLAETPHGAVLAPGQAGSLQVINQMFTELAALYPSPFLHIGADETFDLGVGQTKPAVDQQGLGPVYLAFMQQIDNTLRPLNRRLLFWADIAERSPELLKGMPEEFKRNTIAISWHYSPLDTGFTKYLNYFKSAGFETWVSPGINNWSRVYPNYNMGLENIKQFTRDGQQMGATGQLNTLWYDDGEALASNNWYGILFGCAAAWQQGESSIPQFEANFGPAFHGDMTGKLEMAQQELMAAHDLLRFTAKVGDGSDGLFWLDPWSKDGQQYAEKIRPYTHELRMHAEHALQLIAEARAAYPAPATPVVYSMTNQLPSNPTTLRETNAIDALELGARRFDFIGEKFQLADEMAAGYARAQADATSSDRKQRTEVGRELSDINGVNGRIQDIKDGYSLIRDLYAQLWLRTNRPYALRPVLAHYDYTIDSWLARMDKVRSAQRQWADTHTLPNAIDLEIPPAPPAATPVPPVPALAAPAAPATQSTTPPSN
jgi:hypothetical protein